MSERGGSATVLDGRRLLIAKHVLPGFMLEAFHSGGTVRLSDGSAVPFSGLVLGFDEIHTSSGNPGPAPEGTGDCPLVVSKAGLSDAPEDDWALLESDEHGCFGAREPFPIRADGPVPDGTRVYLIGYPEPRAGDPTGPVRVTIGGSVENLPTTVGTEDHRLLRVRLDRRGDYRGMSGGAAVARNDTTGRLELVGIVLGPDPASSGSGARHAIIRRVPRQVLR